VAWGEDESGTEDLPQPIHLPLDLFHRPEGEEVLRVQPADEHEIFPVFS